MPLINGIQVPAWQDTAKEVVKHLGVTLSKDQAEIFYDDARIKILCGGEGSSKSFMGSLYGVARSQHDAMAASLLNTGFGDLYWVVGHDFETARREFGSLEMDDMLLPWIRALGDLNSDRTSAPARFDQPCILQTKRYNQVIRTISGYDAQKIGREEPTGIIGCEVSLWGEEIWERCYGRLARLYPHSWGWFSGSPELNAGWFDELVNMGDHDNDRDIRSYHLPSWANPSVYPGGREDPAIVQLEGAMSHDRFMRRHGGVITAPTDAVLPEFDAKIHVGDFDFRPDLPVHMAIDPGHFVYAVLFIQVVDGMVRVIDEIYANKWSHEEIINEARMRPLWANVGSGKHVMDIAGSQHHDGDPPTAKRWLDDTDIRFNMKKRRVEDVVERLRSFLTMSPLTGRPRLQVARHCIGTIAEMGRGKSPIDGVRIWKMKNGKPEAANNHACSALGYWGLFYYGTSRPEADDVDELNEEYGSNFVSSYLGGSKSDGLRGDPFETLMLRR